MTTKFRLLVKNIDLTYMLIDEGFSILLEGRGNTDSFTFTLLNKTNTIVNIDVGSKVELFYNNKLLFGGILSKTSSEPSTQRYKPQKYVKCFASGYKWILDRREAEINHNPNSPLTYKQQIQTIINTYLTSEGLSAGIIENDSKIPADFNFDLGSVSGAFASLGESSGYTWWVSPTGKINFTERPIYKPISLSNYKFIELIRSDHSLDGYANRVTVRSDNEFVILEDASEIARMKSIFGSGIYCHPTIENNSLSIAECVLLAKNTLDSNSYHSQTFKILIKDIIEIDNEAVINWQNYAYNCVVTSVEYTVVNCKIESIAMFEYIPEKAKHVNYQNSGRYYSYVLPSIYSYKINMNDRARDDMLIKKTITSSFTTSKIGIVRIVVMFNITPTTQSQTGNINVSLTLDGSDVYSNSTKSLALNETVLVPISYEDTISPGNHSLKVSAVSPSNSNLSINNLTIQIFSEYLHKPIKKANTTSFRSLTGNYTLVDPDVTEVEGNEFYNER